MKTTRFYFLPAVILLFLAGCNASRSQPEKSNETTSFRQVTRNNTTVVSVPLAPGERHLLIRMDSLGNTRVLSSQSSDPEFLKKTALDSNVKVTGTIDIAPLLKAQTELASLGRQSSGVLLTNEALYRLSEAYFNGLIDSSQYTNLYSKVIGRSVELLDAEIELEEAKAETILAETEKIKAELQKAQLQFEMLKFEKGFREEKKTMPDSLKED